MEKTINVWKIMVGRRRRDHLKDLIIDGRIILKSFLNKYGMRVLTGFRVVSTGRLL
jgi:hypothetical protein